MLLLLVGFNIQAVCGVCKCLISLKLLGSLTRGDPEPVVLLAGQGSAEPSARPVAAPRGNSLGEKPTGSSAE